MLKIDKRLTITVAPGTVTYRMASYLEESEKRGLINTVESLRRFAIGGYILQELGSGVLDAVLSMEINGELDGLNKSDRAKQIIKIMRSAVDDEPASKPAPAADPKPPAPAPEKKRPISKIKSQVS